MVDQSQFVWSDLVTDVDFGTDGSLTYSDATGELLLSDAKGRSWHAAPVPADAPDAYDRWLTAIAAAAVVVAAASVPFLPRAFLPAFNEGSLVLGMVFDHGTALAE